MLFHLKQNRFVLCFCSSFCSVLAKECVALLRKVDERVFSPQRIFCLFLWSRMNKQRAKSIHITFPSPLVFFTCSYFKSLMLDYISCNKILKYKIIIDLLLTPPSNCVESSNVIKCSPVKTMCTITGSIGIKRLCSSQVLLIRCT